MASDAKGAEARPDPRLTADEVKAYLERHPDFLHDHPELAQVLTPPGFRRGNGVIDLQRYMLDRLRSEVARLTDTQGELLSATRSNLASQAQIHAAALALLAAADLDHWVHTVTQELPDLLDIDAVALCFEEGGPALPEAVAAGATTLPAGAIAAIFGRGGAVLLRSDRSEDGVTLFGPATSLVRSDALVRLDPGPLRPAGLLGFGSREPGRFDPDQGTELLGFLARVVVGSLDLWLRRPPG